MPNVFFPKHRNLIEEREDEYEGVAYGLTVYDELSHSGSKTRYVEVTAKHLNIREKWREGTEERTISPYFTFLPWVRGRPMTKDEHIEKVMRRFRREVDEYNEFQTQSARQNDGIAIKGDGVMEVTLGGDE